MRVFGVKALVEDFIAHHHSEMTHPIECAMKEQDSFSELGQVKPSVFAFEVPELVSGAGS